MTSITNHRPLSSLSADAANGGASSPASRRRLSALARLTSSQRRTGGALPRFRPAGSLDQVRRDLITASQVTAWAASTFGVATLTTAGAGLLIPTDIFAWMAGVAFGLFLAAEIGRHRYDRRRADSEGIRAVSAALAERERLMAEAA